MKTKAKSKKINIKVIVYSIIAFGFLALTFLVDWIFIIGAVIMIYLNQREIMKRRKGLK
tara:strand:- start:301 stop:477 length:177 start_codon:yes stop_codon:yes gene_type:complete